MPGLLSALEGFCVIGIVIGTGYVAARMRIGGPTAQMVLNQVQLLRIEPVPDVRHPVQGENLRDIPLLHCCGVLLGCCWSDVVFLILNRLFFHLKAADATIGALNSLYLNSNNIGLPIATYILGNPALWSRRFWSCSRRCSRRSA